MIAAHVRVSPEWLRLREAARERRASLRGWHATTSVVAGILAGAAR